MGACLEPTPDMGPYRVEMRGESLYLTRADAAPQTRTGRHEAALPAGDLPALLAALDQATGHPQWEKWDQQGRPGEPDTSWTLAPGDTGPAAPPSWTAARNGDTLHLAGPWTVYHEHGHWSAEIGYTGMDELRAALTAVPAP